MKKVLVFLLIVNSILLLADTIEDSIVQANKLSGEGKLKEAATVLETASQDNPNNPDILAELGNIYSKQAGSTTDFMKAGQLSNQAFTMMDKALKFNPAHIKARLYRGILGANVPAFMGKLQQAQEDLEFINQHVKPMPNELGMTVLFYLGIIYEKQEEFSKALESFKAVQRYAGDSEYGKKAEKKISELEKKTEKQKQKTSPKEEKKNGVSLNQANKLLNEGKLDEAADAYRKILKDNSDNLQANLQMANCLGQIANGGYNSKISEDTEYMSNLAFEIMAVFEKIVELDPDNMEMRFGKNELAIELPFFVGKLNAAIEDLEWIKENKPEYQARTLYLLGTAYKKMANSYWAKAVSECDEETKTHILDRMKPEVQYIEETKLNKPCITIDFVLGFQDELAPQLAVWIEDEAGNFVKTVYVSGFAGRVKGRQTTLPSWAASSEFVDANVVTSASVDIGHHLFIWEMNDFQNKQVKSGNYTIHLEICHWPHVIYEHCEISVSIGKEKLVIKNNENEMIPQIRVSYFPKS